jgi:hypothetical protein
MKKAFKKTIMATAIAAAVGVGSASFAMFGKAPGGKGDLLFSPMYLADASWSSNVMLINSSLEYSVVAKVVFRSALYSEELLDFLVFLSPGDAWSGDIVLNGSTNVVTSSDDSVLVSAGGFATEANPASYPMQTPQNAGDTSAFGYFEIIESAAIPTFGVANAFGAPAAIFPEVQEDGTVLKADIYEYYKAFVEGQTVLEDCTSANDVCTLNVLSGTTTISAPAVGASMGIPLDTFWNYNNIIGLGTGAETLIGATTAVTRQEIDMAMAVNQVVMPYKCSDTAGTFGVFSYPTKETDPAAVIPGVNHDPRILYANPPSVNTPYLPFYEAFNGTLGIDNIVYHIRDMSEHTTVTDSPIISPAPPQQTNQHPYEVNLVELGCSANSIVRNFNADGGAQEGWVMADFPSDPRYSGAPVSASTIQYDAANGGLSMIWTKSAYTKASSL